MPITFTRPEHRGIPSGGKLVKPFSKSGKKGGLRNYETLDEAKARYIATRALDVKLEASRLLEAANKKLVITQKAVDAANAVLAEARQAVLVASNDIAHQLDPTSLESAVTDAERKLKNVEDTHAVQLDEVETARRGYAACNNDFAAVHGKAKKAEQAWRDRVGMTTHPGEFGFRTLRE